MIVDTTVLIDILRGDPNIIKKMNTLEEKNEPLVTTTISVFEVWQGANVLKNTKKREMIHQLLDALATLYFDVDAAKEAASIHTALKKQGLTIDPEDSMIAGIVKVHNETILTRNINHFQRIKGLTVITY